MSPGTGPTITSRCPLHDFITPLEIMCRFTSRREFRSKEAASLGRRASGNLSRRYATRLLPSHHHLEAVPLFPLY